MRRLGILVLALAGLAALLADCGGGEEEEASTASPTATATATPASTATPAATKTATATARPSTATPTPERATPTPPPPTTTVAPPTQQVRQPVWTVSQVSGTAQVDVVVEDGLDNAYTVASVDPEVVQREQWNIESVADLNGDGLVEVIVDHFTGGAHCCWNYLFFSEDAEGIRLDDYFSLGNGPIKTVADLDDDSTPELDASDDRLTYFPDLGFVGSPFLPLVLCRSADGTYHDCTPQFPRKLQESADEFEGHLRDAVERQAEEIEKRHAALGLLASYMRLGMDDEGWSRVRGLCPECEGWLMQDLGELEQRLSNAQPSRQAAQ